MLLYDKFDSGLIISIGFTCFRTVSGCHSSATLNQLVSRLIQVANLGQVQVVPQAIPRVIRNYAQNELEITDELGRGNFGRVDGAVETATGQQVALKTLLPTAGQRQHDEMTRVSLSTNNIPVKAQQCLISGGRYSSSSQSSQYCAAARKIW